MPPAKRQSTRLRTSKGKNEIAPYMTPPSDSSPFLSLSPELVDHILAFLIPKNTAQARKELARSLLPVARSLTPLVRRRLFAKVGLTLGSPSGKDALLLEVLKAEGVAEMLRALRIRAPTVEPTAADIEGGGPGAALVPATNLPQSKIVAMVTTALSRAFGLRDLEVETRIGVQEEDQAGDDGSTWDDAAFERALRGLSLEKLVWAVPHRENKVQVLSDLSRVSAWVPALASWTNLTHLDLWRVRLQLPQDVSVPRPTFRLRQVEVQSSELGGAQDLLWLFGEPGSRRGDRLEHLVLRDVDFLEAPGSSLPLLALFPIDPATPPPFAQTLTSLTLITSHPLTYDGAGDSLSTLLSPLVALKSLELGGDGTVLPLFQSLFTPIAPFDKPPSHSLESVVFNYIPSIPHRDLLDTLQTNINALPRLGSLQLLLHSTHPRTWSWERISQTPLSYWFWPPEDWRALEKWVRGLGYRSGRVVAPGPGAVVLKKNGTEVDCDWESEEEDADDDDDEEGEESEEDMEGL